VSKKSQIDRDIDAFRRVVEDSASIAELQRKLGYKPSGGIHKFLLTKIKKHSIDKSHMLGQRWNKGLSVDTDDRLRRAASSAMLPWEKVFCVNSTVQNSSVIRRLIKSGQKSYKCEICELIDWYGKPIKLQLHHMNGVNDDNQESNLQILCPNCHAQTENWSGKNVKRACGGTADALL
jgi:predicted HNH restriction endonuclease